MKGSLQIFAVSCKTWSVEVLLFYEVATLGDLDQDQICMFWIEA